MATTNYPFGFSDGISLRGVPVVLPIPGKVWWVSSVIGSDGNNGKTKEKPFATIDYAIGKCTDSKGDVIFVMPNHAETISASVTITADVIGISIIGLGNGKQTPRLSLTAVASTITVSAANVTFKNLIVNPGVAEVDAAFTITGSDCVLDGLRCYPVSTFSYESFVLTTATADHLVIKNCDLVQTVAPTANKPFISLVGADYARIENNKLMVTVSDHADSCLIGGATTASLYVIIANNLLTGYAAGTTWLSILKLYTGTTGLVAYNAMAGTVTATTTMNDADTCFSVENYCIKIVAKSGVIDPIAG